MAGELSNRGVHINAVLSTWSVGYHPSGFIAEDVIQVVDVQNETDTYYKWNIGDAFRVPTTIRADGTQANEVTFGFTKDAYIANEYALKFRITDRTKKNYDTPLRLEMSLTRRTKDLMLLDQEVRVATLMRATANYASTNFVTLAGVNQWNNGSFAGSIEQVIDTANEAIRLNTGGNATPNTLILPQAVAKVVKRDTKVREIVKYTHGDLLVNGDLPPTLWNLNVRVPTVTYNTASTEVFGSDTFTGADVWGKDVIITMSPQAPSLDMLAHVYIIRPRGWQVKQWREEEVDSNVYQMSVIQTEKVISNAAGYLIKDAIS